MRLVALADTHGYHERLGPIPEGDVLVHAGDMSRIGRWDELRQVAAWLRGLPHPHKIVIAGNHDFCFEEDQAAARAILGEDVMYLHDSAATVAGWKFWGSPWQPEFGGWAFNLPRGPALAEKWAMIPADTDVLITHGPPMGIGDLTHSNGRQGCADLLQAVQQLRPKLHLFGHIHEDAGVWPVDGVLHANVATSYGDRGATVFDLDPVTRSVVVVTVPSTPAARE